MLSRNAWPSWCLRTITRRWPYWRFGDLASVLALDRFRLEILTYEGGGGEPRPFTFQLQGDLPVGFYDTLCSAVN